MELINKIFEWERNGLAVVENPAISLADEQIYYQFSYEWLVIGNEQTYHGNIFVTDSKIRLVSDSSRQFSFKDILQFKFVPGEAGFKLYPNNGRAIACVPVLTGVRYDQWIEIAKFYAIWKLAEGKKFKDFVGAFSNILNISYLDMDGSVIYERTKQ